MKSIRGKIMLILGGVILLGMVISSVFVINITNKTVTKSEGQIVAGSTDTIVADIDIYFQQYIATVQQMTRDLSIRDLMVSGVNAATVKGSPYYSRVHSMLVTSAEADPERFVSYFVGSGDMAFNETDWISDPGTYDLNAKSYGFNTKEDLDRGLIITEPYQDQASGDMVVTVAAPVYSGDQYIGVVGADLKITAVNQMVTHAKSVYQTGYQVLISSSDMVLAHKNQDAVLKPISEIGFDETMTSTIKNKEQSVVPFDDNGISSFGVVRVSDFTGWKVLSVIPEKEYLQTISSTGKAMFGVYAICFALLVIAIFLVSSGIAAPLKRLTKITDELVQGNLKAEIDIKSKDEVGQLASSMKNLTDRLSSYIAYIEEVSAALDDFGRGNLNIQLHQAYDGEFAQLKNAMLQTSSIFKKTIGDLLQISDSVSIGSDQVASGAQMLAQGATEQASSIEELSATIQEVSGNITRNAEHAVSAAAQVKTVGDAADKSNEQMTQMIAAIRQINEKSTEIGKIIKTIDDIAFQTNILALNAAVEAARAGVAGKGFAVVADEVRSLASKSAEAAKVTTALIEDSIRAVENGTAIADQTGKMLSDVLNGVTQTVGLINEISSASAIQATTISQIVVGVDQISAVVQTNSATAEESSAASEELAGQATLLKDVSQRFKV